LVLLQNQQLVGQDGCRDLRTGASWSVMVEPAQLAMLFQVGVAEFDGLPP
jgi:hypothetical protein